MAQKVTMTPLSDITSLIVGTDAPWYWEVQTVYVSGVDTVFSWSNGVVSIPSYSTGTVLVEYTLYLLHGMPSQYLPSDPTDPGSDLVYWENRLSQFISYSTSMKAFETGLNDINVGSVSIQLDDDWLALSTQVLILPNRVIRIYRDDVIAFKGIATKHSVNGYVITLNVQKRITVLDSECNFGDPAYLNRIDRSSNTAYYNGANIPEEFEGVVIPMLIGPEFPYDQTNYEEIDLGNPNAAFLPANAITKFSQKNINTGAFVVKVIPVSASIGIIGRMPSFQTLVSSPADHSILPTVQRFYERSEQINTTTVAANAIPGETVILFRNSDSKTNIGRVWRIASGVTFAFLGLDDPSFLTYDSILDYSETEHWFQTNVPNSSWTLPAVASGATTPAGNKWITANFTGVDLRTIQVYVVFTGITDTISHFEVMQWLLEKHGFTVDTDSFDDLAAEFPSKTIQQIGLGNNMPTLGSIIGEMNRTYMTALVFPQDNDVPFIKKIDAAESYSVTIDESQISDPVINSEYRMQAKNVIFRPLYARSDIYKYSLFRNYSAPNATLFGSEKTYDVDHIIQDVDTPSETRFQEMTEIFGSPAVSISFEIFDDDVELELGDMVFVDHPKFSQKIMITSIENRPIGRAIQGRYLYVN